MPVVGSTCAAGPITLRAALARYGDLLAPVGKPALQAFAAFAQGEEQQRLQHMLSPEGVAAYKEWHQQSRCLLEVLEEFPGVRPPLGEPLAARATDGRLVQRRFQFASGRQSGRPARLDRRQCDRG